MCHAAWHVGSQFPDGHRNCTPCLEKCGVLTTGLPGKPHEWFLSKTFSFATRGLLLTLRKEFYNSLSSINGYVITCGTHTLKTLKTQSPHLKAITEGFPGGSVVKNAPADAEDAGSIPDPGRSHTPQGN